ncbi:HEAT repeat domain-containing protein [Actinoplanes sp. M2I2]|uniref:HEAT repeat domain-containing protein n=1 Tax=Actinoplanes sp. M2I2 TaxID=1734444 RepID=UPI002021F11A|nr:HEAT repeat domain-containing protein [Actinoplanes sp. M2I2]
MNLLSEDEDAFQAALIEAVRSGASGERELLAALGSVQDEDQAAGIVSALGEAQGPGGVAALREIIAEPDDPLEVRTTAVVALTKRQGVEATDVLRACLNDRDRHMLGYALKGLASVGDDRAWSDVLEWLRQYLDEQPPNPEHDLEDRVLVAQSRAVPAAAYLARHSASDWERQRPVVALLRSRWNRLRGAEQRWLTAHWPASDPALPESFTQLDATWFADWVSRPLYKALYLN